MMRIIAKFDREAFPFPKLSCIIYDAPHRRVHWRVLQNYREELRRAFLGIGIIGLIDEPIDYALNMVDPTSPDNDNLITAFHRAMDNKALIKPGLITDDSLLQSLQFSKFWTKVR
jgi:hypothetical protein